MSIPRAHGLRIEALEPKQPLAGDVMVSVDAGVLNIVGDELDNQIAITSGEEPGTYVVAGGPGTNIIFRPGDGSGPQAPEMAVEVSGVRTVRAAMGEGNDTVSINDARFSGNVRIATGQGEDRVLIGVPLPPPPGPAPAGPDEAPAIEAAGMVSIGGGLSIHTGGDNDVAVVDNARIRRNVSIAAGAGDDTVRVGRPDVSEEPGEPVEEGEETPTRPSVAVGRSLRVGLGAGEDTYTSNGAAARGGIGVSGGQGSDAIRLVDTASRVLHVHGGRGDASETVRLRDVDAVLASIATAGGADEVGIRGGRFGALGVALGAGDDTLSIGDTDAAFAALLGGPGDADELVRLGGNRFGRAFVRGFELPADDGVDDDEEGEEGELLA